MELKDTSNGLNKTIKVGFLSEQNSGWMGGINYYKNLFIAISKIEHPKIIPYILAPKDENAKILLNYAHPIELKKDIKYLLTKIAATLKGKKFNKNEYLYKNIDIDLVSNTQSTEYSPAIAWIPDFQHIHLPEMFSEEEINYRSANFRKLAEKSLLVILSSEDALNDFKKFIPEFAHKGRVLNFVAIPDENIYKLTDEITQKTIKKFDLSEKYFYVPNQFWIHKNHKVVLEAISILKVEGININVVFTGNTSDYRHANYFNDLMEFVKEKGIENNIKLLGLVDLNEVFCLMRNCISIINPSLFEGWSSTVEESKSLGKNIILSNINVHKEQNPPRGVYFNPYNANELADILKDKWLKGKSGPDFDLEELAQSQLEKRIIEFGKTYRQIVLDGLNVVKS